MAFNVVYADKNKIKSSIEQGIIPKESLILTTDENQSEAYYYDDEGNLKYITKKTSFDSIIEARAWIAKYDYKGEVISIFQNKQWTPYLVNEDNSITEIGKTSQYSLIDGGNA